MAVEMLPLAGIINFLFMTKCRVTMCQLFLAVGFFFLAQIANAQGGKYTISGRIKGVGNTKVLLTNKPRGFGSAFKTEIFDSCYSRNDYFSFSGKLDEPKFLSIEIPSINADWVSFIGENADIRIDGNKDSIYYAQISGSRQTDIYLHYINDIYYAAHRNDRRILDSLSGLKDTIKSKELVSAYRSNINRRDEAVLFRQIVEHPDNYGLLYELAGISIFIPKDTAQKYYLKFSNKLRQGTLGKRLQYELFEYANVIQKGKRLPDFSMADTAQRKRSLSAFRGKYVLLDFWASWCGPCLDELPELKKIDSLYHSKGLEIVGISLDTDKRLWKEAIKENNMKWTNLSDLKGSNNKAGQLLRVNAIPARFLIDPNGNLLTINSPLSEVEELLSGLLK